MVYDIYYWEDASDSEAVLIPRDPKGLEDSKQIASAQLSYDYGTHNVGEYMGPDCRGSYHAKWSSFGVMGGILLVESSRPE